MWVMMTGAITTWQLAEDLEQLSAAFEA